MLEHAFFFARLGGADGRAVVSKRGDEFVDTVFWV